MAAPTIGSPTIVQCITITPYALATSVTTTIAGMAAVDQSDAWAVGATDAGSGANASYHPFIMRWDGRGWAHIPSPGAGFLRGVSASGPTDAWAVGATLQGRHTPLVYHWDGHAWASISVRLDRAGADGVLTAVAAVSPDDVWAVGYQESLTTTAPLIAHWDGRHWRAMSDASPAPSGGQLFAVTALASDDVWAVGSASSSTVASTNGAPSARVTLTEHWDGRRWQIIDSPNAPTGDSQFFGVSGVSSQDVWAVGGTDAPEGHALVAHWDGTAWNLAVQEVQGTLRSVVAISPRDVWAVGSTRPAVDGQPAQVLLRHWDGTQWHTLTAPSAGAALTIAASGPSDILSGGTKATDLPFTELDAPAAGSGSSMSPAPSLFHIGPLPCDTATLPRVVNVVHVGVNPIALAVDSATGHVFVANQGPDNAQSDYPYPPDRILTSPVPTGPGSVAMLDATTGAVIRTQPVTDAPMAVAADEQHNAVFVATTHYMGGNPVPWQHYDLSPYAVRMFDGASGHLLHTEWTGSNVPQSMIVAPRAGRVFVADGPGVTALDSRTGQLLPDMTAQMSGDFGPSPLLLTADDRTGRLYVGNGCGNSQVEGCVATYSITTAAPLFTAPAGEPIDGMALDTRNGRLVTAGQGGHGAGESVEILDARTGVTKHDISMYGVSPPDFSVGVDSTLGHTIVVGSADPYEVDYGNDAPMAVTLLDTRTGRILHSDTFDWSVSPQYTTLQPIVVDESTHRAFVLIEGVDHSGTYEPGSIATIDMQSGQILQTMSMGPRLGAFALDAQTGRLFVSNLSAGTVTVLDVGTAPSRDWREFLPTATYRLIGTQHTLSDPFQTFWRRNDGIFTLGSPLTEPFLLDGHLAQYTDDALLQVIDGQVIPAPLGRLLTEGRHFPRIAPFHNTPRRLYFSRTGHSLAGPFLTYWRTHHGRLLLGAPISEVSVEANGSGQRLPTQWFERGRLEYHAEVTDTAYAVDAVPVGWQALQRYPPW